MPNEKVDPVAGFIGLIIGFAALALFLFVGSVIDGWFISTAWNWFMPVIFKLPSIPIAAAVGISCIWSMFTDMPTMVKPQYAEEPWKVFGMRLIRTLLLLVIAYFAHGIYIGHF